MWIEISYLLPELAKGDMPVVIMDLLSLTYAQLEDEFRQRYGRGAFHAAALYRSFFQGSSLDLSAVPAFRASVPLGQQVQRDLKRTQLKVVDRLCQEDVTKLVFQYADGCRVETVVIPMANHWTVCISSQVGCRMGCRFCETGRMGWQRQLSAGEIVAQVHAVKVGLGKDVRNVVLMGMGEPLDNFGQVTQAIRVLEDQRGLNIAKRHITLSTVGLVDGIERLAALNWPQLKLAVSLNAATDSLRSKLMPAIKEHSLGRLKNVLARYPLSRGNALLMQYVLIKGINDQPQHAEQLADYLHGLPVKLNLIPYNPRRQSPFDPPSTSDVERFHKVIVAKQVFVRLRRSKGVAIRAACGQLGGNRN